MEFLLTFPAFNFVNVFMLSLPQISAVMLFVLEISADGRNHRIIGIMEKLRELPLPPSPPPPSLLSLCVCPSHSPCFVLLEISAHRMLGVIKPLKPERRKKTSFYVQDHEDEGKIGLQQH